MSRVPQYDTEIPVWCECEMAVQFYSLAREYKMDTGTQLLDEYKHSIWETMFEQVCTHFRFTPHPSLVDIQDTLHVDMLSHVDEQHSD